MKRLAKAALLLGFMLLLGGCTAYSNVEDLLRAPQIQGPQSEVQRALTSYLGEAPQLKYPQSGESLSPFLFGDWNGDGVEDAAALYVSAAKGQNVHLAILEQTAGGWTVTQEKEGLSTSVESVATAGMDGSGGMQLLIAYTGASGEKYLAVYAYQDRTLSEVIQQPYSQYEVQDITGSGLNDLILIGPETGEGLQLQLLTTIEGQFILAQELWIGADRFVSCEGLYVSRGADGSCYLVLDGRTGAGANLATMVLRYDPIQQQLVEYVPTDGADIHSETQRYSSLLTSRDIDGDGTVEIPCELPDTSGLLTVNRLTFVSWLDYTYDRGRQKSFGIADLENGYYLRLPASWQGQVTVTDGDEPGSWEVRSLDGETVYLQVRVVEPSAEGSTYFRLGNIGAQKVQARILAAHIGDNGTNLLASELAAGFTVL